jgi:hypothetical protein
MHDGMKNARTTACSSTVVLYCCIKCRPHKEQNIYVTPTKKEEFIFLRIQKLFISDIVTRKNKHLFLCLEMYSYLSFVQLFKFLGHKKKSIFGNSKAYKGE